MTFLTTAAAAVLAALLLERLGVPSGALLGAMLGVMALNLAGRPVPAMAPGGRFVAFVILGWIIGSQFTPDTLAVVRAAVIPVALSVVALVLSGAAVAWGLCVLTGVDPASAFLAASPGALSQMAAVSDELGANVAFVTTMHVVRVVAVLLIAPFIGVVLTRN